MQLSSFPNGAGQELACVWPARSTEDPVHADVLQVISERSGFCDDSTVLDIYVQGLSKHRKGQLFPVFCSVLSSDTTVNKQI